MTVHPKKEEPQKDVVAVVVVVVVVALLPKKKRRRPTWNHFIDDDWFVVVAMMATAAPVPSIGGERHSSLGVASTLSPRLAFYRFRAARKRRPNRLRLFFFRPARRSKSTRDQRSESSLSTSRRVNWFASESGRRRRPEICKWECTPVCKWGDAAGMSIRALVSSLKTFLCEEKKSFSICIDCSSTLTRNHFNLVWKQNPTKPLQKWFNEQWNDEKIPQKSLLWFQLERNRVTNRFKPRKTQSTVGGNINDLSWAFAETQLTKPNFFFEKSVNGNQFLWKFF